MAPEYCVLFPSQTNPFQCFSIDQQPDAFQPEEAKEQGDGQRGKRSQQEERQDCTRGGADRRLEPLNFLSWKGSPDDRGVARPQNDWVSVHRLSGRQTHGSGEEQEKARGGR